MEKLYQLYLQYPTICTDTRNIKQNSIFFCLKGENFDGNQFALQALSKGALHVVTEDTTLSGRDDCTVVTIGIAFLSNSTCILRSINR